MLSVDHNCNSLSKETSSKFVALHVKIHKADHLVQV